MALSWLSLAALGVLGFLLGRRLYGVWVGAAVAVVLLTRRLLVGETHQAVLDLPFLALVVGALLAEVGRPRERTLVPVLLCLAGLLRPEGWLLGLAWLLYAAPGHPRAQVLRWGALVVVAAPLVWALWDLVVTGDPLWSLHGTQDLAEELERPRAIGTALSRGALLPARRARRPDRVARPRRSRAAACCRSTSARCCPRRWRPPACSASSRSGSPTSRC